MKFTVRKCLAVSTVTAVLCGFAIVGPASLQAADAPVKGKLTQKSLGQLLKGGLGLKPTTLETRYDFRFQAKHDEDWALSMSAVLSNDGESVWLMAWLDELPSSAREVPRKALLRLLMDNDRMGGGKFFAYVPGNRRFILQRVVPNRGMTTKKFRALLKDLGKTVADTHGHWNVASWGDQPAPSKTKTAAGTSRGKKTATATPASGTTTKKRRTSAKPSTRKKTSTRTKRR